MPNDNYASIRYVYASDIGVIMSDYLRTDGARVTSYRNRFTRAIIQAFFPAFEAGVASSGGELPLDTQSDAWRWINDRINQEIAFDIGLFDHLRDDIKKGSGPDSFEGEIAARAENYAKTLDGVYSQGLAMGSKDVRVCLGGSDGDESCETCQRLKGKWKLLSEVIAQGLLIQPGNENYICKGYNCQHYWWDQFGKIYTA